MEQKENFLAKVYKSLLSTAKDQNSLEDELKVSKILDEKNGIFNIEENKVFNFDAKSDIFSENKGNTIFENSFENNVFSANNNDTLEAFKIMDLGFNKGGTESGLGGNFDRIG